MEVHFSDDVEARLTRLATERGRDREAIVLEMVERAVGYEEWFVREVESRIAAADRDEFVEHDGVLKLVNNRYPG